MAFRPSAAHNTSTVQTMLHDRARIHVAAGAGGNGAVSFRREAHVPRGGPDGGDGGRGGDVVIVCDPSRRDLAAQRYSPHHRAGRGGHGQGQQRHGARGEDELVAVPPGTVVEGIDGEPFDLVTPGQRAIVAGGGLGGHGNKRFASSTRQAPRFAERGLPGEEGWIELRLKLLADAGLVGLPNAGKSSLLARLTRATPKVAEYPFTTLEPVLGTIDDGERQVVLADIPGLIEGAATGAGLGHEFLAHVERCRVLVHLLAVDPLGRERSAQRLRDRPPRARRARRAARPSCPRSSSSRRPTWPRPRSSIELAGELGRELGGVERPAGVVGDHAPASTSCGGRSSLRSRRPPSRPARPPRGRRMTGSRPSTPSTGRRATGASTSCARTTAFRVTGRGVEMLFARHDLANLEALAYLEAAAARDRRARGAAARRIRARRRGPHRRARVRARG